MTHEGYLCTLTHSVSSQFVHSVVRPPITFAASARIGLFMLHLGPWHPRRCRIAGRQCAKRKSIHDVEPPTK